MFMSTVKSNSHKLSFHIRLLLGTNKSNMKDAEPQSEIKLHLLPTVPINDSQLQKGHLFLSYKGSGLLYGE